MRKALIAGGNKHGIKRDLGPQAWTLHPHAMAASPVLAVRGLGEPTHKLRELCIYFLNYRMLIGDLWT